MQEETDCCGGVVVLRRDLPETAVKEEPATREGPTLPSNDFSDTTEGTESIPGHLEPASQEKPDDPGVTSKETP
ncbi:hypothetical protein E2C01_039419 [Portunus trituberculatus]|uniref:Uncharacterized protein n=1 Tax=Portunus trituberculatus TaxID=210409 RepID=A0A5B7FKM8_PORTR|nr:hypothetical protein [Portunus trituberculatus]